ncbi:MAG: tRNA (adenosine(37)-N6)-threonylcarbamoyltransferase complex dimerization subunit type 1 TsaB [Gammaproteobacteria bacterium]|nr:tRNA (adenosine(37)-N6)-threonylcarbamoyltransferase complex dimerization subunit type 1 TsaB [Gammaproteobacteria bacterium]
MRLLAIDTATDACSAALHVDGAIIARHEIAPRQHAKLILPMIGSLLAESGLVTTQLDAIAFGRGPGAFTGVRIAVGVVQGIAFAADLPVVAVSDLAAIAVAAKRVHDAPLTLACLDARMREVYWGIFDCEGQQPGPRGAEHLSAPDAVCTDIEVYAAGPGWSAYPAMAERLAPQLLGSDTTLLPHAADIARIAVPMIERGETTPAEQALPVYLRDEVAWKKA